MMRGMQRAFLFAVIACALLPYGSDVIAQDAGSLLPDSIWFDADTGNAQAVPVKDSVRDSVNRDSRWLPKPKKLSKPKPAEAAKGQGANAAGGGTGGGTGGGFSGMGLSLGNLFGWLLIILLVGLAAVALYALMSRFEPDDVGGSQSARRRQRQKPDEQTLERIAALPPELRRTDVNMRSEAERLMGEGQYDLAIILLFGHQLLTLDGVGMIRLQRGKTNRRYLRECRGADRDAAGALRQTTELFERSFFGGHAIAPDDFARAWKANELLERVADSRPGVAA
ncbi:MAG: DUF4129 domain-containing protein [Planctomycetota bacterium]